VAQLLLVEDDADIRRALIHALAALGHAVANVPTAMGAIQHIVNHRPDLVVLDLGLPDVDGLKLLGMLRAVSDVPIVIATARDEESAIVEALNQGADDYVVKPFSASQLDARIRAVLRRAGASARDTDEPLIVGELQLRYAAREATLAGVRLDLTPREFELLNYLASRAGAVVTKRELLNNVWRQPYGGADKTIDVHLSWLRRKLGERADQPRYLHTIRGVGVKLAPPSDATGS
jgi:two-component system, OmpR family, KDP operon response regulator KdpE